MNTNNGIFNFISCREYIFNNSLIIDLLIVELIKGKAQINLYLKINNRESILFKLLFNGFEF